MNNEELKKKLIKSIRQGFANADCRNPYTNVPYPYFDLQIFCIADALIAAGIGDVREYESLKIELRQKVDYIHELWEVKEDYKHRAEVAERALKICLIDNLHCYECDIGFDGKCKGTDKDKEKCAMLEIDDYIQQAEEELAEEKEK